MPSDTSFRSCCRRRTLKTVNWFSVAGVVLGTIVANVLNWGVASINGMAVAAVCYMIGQLMPGTRGVVNEH